MKTNAAYDMDGYAVMGSAIEVYNIIGGGLLEEIYDEAIGIEFALRKIPYQKKKKLAMSYKGHKLSKNYFPDYITHDRIMVELKSVSTLNPGHEAQLMNYMRLAKFSVGYLINFGPTDSLEWKRFVL